MAEEILLGDLTVPEHKPSKRRGPRVILSDDPLWNHRNQLVQIFENSWGEIGWQLQTLKNPDDLIPPFSIHPNTWIRNELSVFLHPSSTTSENPRKLRSRLDAVTRLFSKSDETFRRASKDWERAQQVPSGINRKLRRLIISETEPIRRRYARAKQTCVALALEEKQLRDRLRSAESEFARNEAFDFLRTGPRRYELTPLHLANALAGLPYTKWRRSMTRCVDKPCPIANGRHYQVFKAVRFIAESSEKSTAPKMINYFHEQIPRLPPHHSAAMKALAEHLYYIQDAITQAHKRKPYHRRQWPFEIMKYYERQLPNQARDARLIERFRIPIGRERPEKRAQKKPRNMPLSVL